MALAPVFLLFLVTHAILIVGGIVAHARRLPETPRARRGRVPARAVDARRARACCCSFVHAYSLGGGTYTGIEAVSNGLPIMREPRVQTAQAHDALHGGLARVHRAGPPPLLPALGHRARRGQDA